MFTISNESLLTVIVTMGAINSSCSKCYPRSRQGYHQTHYSSL